MFSNRTELDRIVILFLQWNQGKICFMKYLYSSSSFAYFICDRIEEIEKQHDLHPLSPETKRWKLYNATYGSWKNSSFNKL